MSQTFGSFLPLNIPEQKKKKRLIKTSCPCAVK